MNRLTKKDPYWLDEEFWVSAEEPDMETIDEVYLRLRDYENTELFPQEIEQLKQQAPKKGEWIEIGLSHYDEFDKSYKCSLCEKEINGDILNYFQFCHKCGADMRK